MPAVLFERPAAGDYIPYFDNYISLVPAGDLVAHLRAQQHEVRQLLEGVSDTRADYRYADGKWNVREVLGHLTDTERVFSYRATHFARGDRAPLPGFEQDDWNATADFHARPMAELLSEWLAVREATIALVRAMPLEGARRHGVAGGNGLSVLAALAIVYGHVAYHLRQLRDVYLAGAR